jgi:ABC-type uncharacterized transport system substrate-binding protein
MLHLYVGISLEKNKSLLWEDDKSKLCEHEIITEETDKHMNIHDSTSDEL